jgi:hypothetical protein
MAAFYGRVLLPRFVAEGLLARATSGGIVEGLRIPRFGVCGSQAQFTRYRAICRLLNCDFSRDNSARSKALTPARFP